MIFVMPMAIAAADIAASSAEFAVLVRVIVHFGEETA